MRIDKYKLSCGITGISVSFTREEAVAVIETIAHQLVTGDPNTGRKEFYGHSPTIKSEGFKPKIGYFTISVNDYLVGLSDEDRVDK